MACLKSRGTGSPSCCYCCRTCWCGGPSDDEAETPYISVLSSGTISSLVLNIKSEFSTVKMCMLRRDDVTLWLRARFIVKLQIFRLTGIFYLLHAVVAITVFFSFPLRKIHTVLGVFTGTVEVE
jgi:hypothetical protein